MNPSQFDAVGLHRLELLQAEDYSRYLLTDQTDVAFLLRLLARKRSFASLFYGRNGANFPTVVLDVDPDNRFVLLDAPPRPPQVLTEAVLAQDYVVATTLDRVKIQFAASRMEVIDDGHGTALRLPVPDRLLRLQRRDYYRLVATPAEPLDARLMVGETSLPREMHADVLDISSGGIAVLAPPSELALTADLSFERCEVEIPGEGVVAAGLVVRNVFAVSRDGHSFVRAGCQFVGLSGSMSAMIERYIMRVDRTRKNSGA